MVAAALLAVGGSITRAGLLLAKVKVTG